MGGGEATKEAVVSRRLQTPVVLQAVNTSLFTTGNGAHLDLGSLSAGKVSDYNKPGTTQGLHSLKKQQGLIIRERHQMSITKTNQKKLHLTSLRNPLQHAGRCIYVTDHLPCQVVVGSEDFKNAGQHPL